MKKSRTQKYPETSTFHYYNANPKNRVTGDCWLRAICTALNEPYNDVLMEMVEIHIETGYELSCDKAVEKYMERKGWKKHKQPRKDDNTKYTGKEFCEQLQKDPWIFTGKDVLGKTRLLANIGGHHMVAIVDGKVNDTWNSTFKCIGNYWTKED